MNTLKATELCALFWLLWVFLAALRLLLVSASGGYSLLLVRGFLIAVASRCRAQAVKHAGSVFAVHGLNCSMAWGIFPDQELNPCPLHWQWILNHWTTREVWIVYFKWFILENSLDPVVRTWHFHCCGPGSIPGQGTKILQAMWHSWKKKKFILCYVNFILFKQNGWN